jgi:hypothetical protein
MWCIPINLTTKDLTGLLVLIKFFTVGISNESEVNKYLKVDSQHSCLIPFFFIYTFPFEYQEKIYMIRLYFYPVFIIYITFLSVVHGDNRAPTMDSCPTLENREVPAKDVLDLRVDDIAYIASIGDRYYYGI